MYNERTRRQAIDLVQSGLTPEEASRKMGGRPTGNTIKKWIDGKLPTGKRSKRCYIPVAAKEQAIKRLFMGESYVSVAAEIGCAPESLLAWRRKYLEGGVEAITTARDTREEINRQMRERLHLTAIQP